MKPLNISLLKVEIASDLSDLGRIASEVKNLEREIGSSEPTYRDKAAFGALLHSFYNGIENILKRIAEEVDGSVPVGEGWHRALLKRMERSVDGVRPALLDSDTVRLLRPYLGFRHFFRHSYTFEIDWLKLKPLVESIEVTLEKFKSDLSKFLDFLSNKDQVL